MIAAPSQSRWRRSRASTATTCGLPVWPDLMPRLYHTLLPFVSLPCRRQGAAVRGRPLPTGVSRGTSGFGSRCRKARRLPEGELPTARRSRIHLDTGAGALVTTAPLFRYEPHSGQSAGPLPYLRETANGSSPFQRDLKRAARRHGDDRCVERVRAPACGDLGRDRPRRRRLLLCIGSKSQVPMVGAFPGLTNLFDQLKSLRVRRLPRMTASRASMARFDAAL